jgi:arginine decarboxylase
VYSTQSTHKTLTSLRQGSTIHVWDQDFGQKVEDTFHEAYMTHTSTSPNYQILASLDLGRRQAALEGFELVLKQIENAMRLRDAVEHHPLLRPGRRRRPIRPGRRLPLRPLPERRSGLQYHLAWRCLPRGWIQVPVSDQYGHRLLVWPAPRRGELRTKVTA